MSKLYLRSLFVLLLGVVSTCCLTAQDKKLTLSDAAYLNREIFPERLRNIQWVDNDHFVYVFNNAVVKESVKGKRVDTILRLVDLSAFIIKEGGERLTYIPYLSFSSDNICTFSVNNTLYQYSIAERKGVVLNSYPEDAENIDIHLHTHNIAYTKGSNLYISVKGQEKSVTKDTVNGIVNGVVVHRNEFGITKGTFWSPDGTKLAFYRMDESMVEEYPLVDITTRIASASPIRYPMAGMKSHHVTLGIWDVKTGKTVFVKTEGDPEQYLTNITWSPNSVNLFIAILNRDQDHMRLSQFDATTGDFISTLFEEESKNYVEPLNGPIFLPNDPTEFIWQSERYGHNHLYLYNINGKLVREITQGKWDVTEFIGFDEKGQNLFFTATKESPLQRNIYRYNFSKGTITKLTLDHGTHYGLFNKTGSFFIDIFSSTDVAGCYKLMSTTTKKGQSIRTLFSSPDPLQDYTLGEMTIDKIQSDNNVDLYYRLIKPVGFDPQKKYPAIVYVYGGPHAQLVTDSWLGGNDLFLFYLAQEGYVVFTIDKQGSAGRGHDFESIIHRKLGQQERRDQMEGVNFLKSHPWVDETRIGIDGWSYGGFMTINMLLSYPGVFKAGCAGGPVCDWKYYEIMYGERYMDRPDQNPEGYKNASLIERADQLQDHLLIIHGTADDVVVWQHSLDFIKRCIENGIQVDYFVYPEHRHNVRGRDRVHLYQKIKNYFDGHLKP